MYLGTHFDAPFRTTSQIENALEAFTSGVFAGKSVSTGIFARYVYNALDIEDDELAQTALLVLLQSENRYSINQKGDVTVF